MIDKLKRWAELEPDRCNSLKQENPERTCFYLTDYSGWMAYENPSMEDLHLLQGAVQQAILARGFTWRIEYNHVWKSWDADIEDDFETWTRNSKRSPAESLLAAYLAALEATAEAKS